MSEPKSTIFIVDDDEAIRSGMSLLLESYGYCPETFDSAENFLTRCDETMPTPYMAILDLSMPGMDGLALQDELHRRSIDMPVVFLSGEGDIPIAVNAVHHGAIDFLEKPVDSDILFARIQKALDLQNSRNQENEIATEIQARLETLTSREREVLDHITGGKMSKAIALELGISERTVELHRSRVLNKMGVRNSMELLNQLIPALPFRESSNN